MSNNPQWKMFQPPESHSSPLHDILDLQHNSMQSKQSYRNGCYSGEYPSSPRDTYNNGVKSGSGAGAGRFPPYSMDSCPMGDANYSTGTGSGSGGNNSGYDSSTHPPIRETGIIEKLLHSYGFIQCCERQARLFFHFSQFSGNTEHLKIGDPVEFEMTYDRRTGKPIASTVTKIAPEVVLSEARVTGTVTTEVKGEGSGDNTGRISYENRGECFFLPYTKDDVEGNVVLRTGDAVSFQIATNQRGTLGACHVRFENPQHPVKYHGVVCSMKDNFGFIERADVVKEIFFHFSEAKVKDDLMLGDDVEFLIQTRNGKEVACNICKLPGGSVVFEDVAPDTLRGQVLKPLERGAARAHDPLPGRLRYRAPDHSEVEVPFGDKDQCGEFTLRHGDWVRFQVATDRRDRLRRATNIALLDESFSVSGERRERGVVRSLRDGFGFIACVERERPLLFRFEEVLRLGRELSVGDELEFTVDPPATFANGDSRQAAIRIKHLPAGSVAFETLVERGVRGAVLQGAAPPAPGLLLAHLAGRAAPRATLPFRAPPPHARRAAPAPGDEVLCDVYQVKRTKELIADGVQVTSGAESVPNGAAAAPSPAARPAPRDGARDGARDVARDGVWDVARDGVRDVARDGVRDAARDGTRDGARDGARDGTRDAAREGARDGTRDAAKDRARDGTREIVRDGARDGNKDGARDGARDGTRDGARDGTRDGARDAGPAHGFIAALKDGFGFIETADHSKEVFFHFSNLEGNADSLELGGEVEYAVGRGGGGGGGGGGCASAEWVRAVAPGGGGSPPAPRPAAPTLAGTVTRTLRALNPDQAQYAGVVRAEGGAEHEFGITGLACKREILQVGDPVTFQVDAEGRAANIVPVRKKRRATVDAIKGGFGFLSLSGGAGGEEGAGGAGGEARRLFFHMSEVRGAAADLQPGDTVEFVMLTNPRNGKCSACNVVKIQRGKARPERLLARLRAGPPEESAPRVVALRAPRGPDGTRGFRARRARPDRPDRQDRQD